MAKPEIMSIVLTKRFYKFGIISVFGIIILNVISGVYSYLQMEPSILTAYVLNFSLLIFQLTVWILIRKILIYKHTQIDLDRILLWIIRLIASIGTLNILGISFNNPMFLGFILVLALVNFGLIITLAIKIWRIEEFEFDSIEIIKNYILAMLIISILSIIIQSINDVRLLFNERVDKLNIEYIEYLLKLIPFIFLLLFIKKELKTASA